MGILTEMTAENFASPQSKRENLRESVISKGAQIFDNNKSIYRVVNFNGIRLFGESLWKKKIKERILVQVGLMEMISLELTHEI